MSLALLSSLLAPRTVLRFCALFAVLLGSGGGLDAQTLEDFETYVVPPIGYENTQVSYLDEHTITASGQGPGLVASGCAYVGNGGTFQWNGDGYYGLSTQTINFTSDPKFEILYDAPATSLSFELKAYLGYSDSVNLYLYDSNGTLISSTLGLAVPAGSSIPFLYSGTGVSKIAIVSQLYPWSPILDNHQYLSPMHLTILGPCPGRKHVLLNGASAYTLVAFGVGTPGSYTIPGGPCAGTVVNLDNPFLGGLAFTDGNGDLAVIVKVPASVCGLSVQALDVATCEVSNVAAL